MGLISDIVGSVQTSKAVNSLVGNVNSAISNVNGTTGTDQSNIIGAGQNANAMLSPYTSLGSTASNNLNTALSPGGSLTSQFSFDPTQIANNPDYQFQLQQGLQAVKQAAAATGTLGSSQTLKGLTNYAGGLASSEIGQAYNQALGTYQTNFGNTLNANLAGTQTGLSATNTAGANLIGTNRIAGNWGQANATNVAQLMLDRGQAQASGSIAQGNIWSPFAGGVAGSLYNAAGAPIANATGGSGAVAAIYNALG